MGIFAQDNDDYDDNDDTTTRQPDAKGAIYLLIYTIRRWTRRIVNHMALLQRNCIEFLQFHYILTNPQNES